MSSPLTLGYDLTDDNITERVWPIISNHLAIEINHGDGKHLLFTCSGHFHLVSVPVPMPEKMSVLGAAWAGSPGKLLSSVVSPHVNATFLGRRCGGGPAKACCTHHDGPPGGPVHLPLP